jgi:hypothetical protein
MTAPDFAAAIVGWRAWLVVERPAGLRLASVVQPTVWEPRHELRSDCLANHRRLWAFGRRRPGRHSAPEAWCTCGIYASTDAEVAGQYFLTPDVERPKVVAGVIGLVSLWGRVLACSRGWRAEYAYPARICVPIRAEDVSGLNGVEELAFSLAEYGVPVEIVSHRGKPDLLRTLAPPRARIPRFGRR